MGVERLTSAAIGARRGRPVLALVGEATPRVCPMCGRDLEELGAHPRAVFCGTRCRKRSQVQRRKARERARDGHHAPVRAAFVAVGASPEAVPVWVDTRVPPLPGVHPAAQGAYPFPPQDQVPGEPFWSHQVRHLLLVRGDESAAGWVWDRCAGRVPSRPSAELVALARARGWPVPKRWA